MTKEFWDERFAGKEYVYGTKPNSFFKKSIEQLTPGKLLLPGEGEGRNAVFAASKGWQVTAIDQSSEAKRKAIKLAMDNNCNFQYHLLDIMDLETETVQYDVIGLFFFHLPPEIRKKAHQLLVKKLIPGGQIILEAFSKSQLGKTSGGPPVLEMLFDKQILEGDFKDLKIIDPVEKTVMLNEGSFHQGEASVIQLIGQKSY